MLQHVFTTMNELLDQIIQQYPRTKGQQKQELEHQIALLCSMSDYIMEEWLRFEERLSLIKLKNNTIKTAKPVALHNGDPYQRGQGYYLLMMYEDAVKYLEQAAQLQPESIEVRACLAMSHLHLEHFQKAGHHFQFIISLTCNNSMKAIACNAMGCIHAKQQQFAEAQAYFQKAHQLDPTFPEPAMNLKVCQSKSGQLELGGEHMTHMQ